MEQRARHDGTFVFFINCFLVPLVTPKTSNSTTPHLEAFDADRTCEGAEPISVTPKA